jgi:hypothetical protein
MRYLLVIAVAAVLAAPAYAQQQEDPADFIKKRDAKELDKEYKSTLSRMPSKSTKFDPWGNVRDAAQPEPAAADPGKRPQKPN